MDVLDLVAGLFVVLFTIRKLDSQQREPGQYPHVPESAFLKWRTTEVRVYQIASIGSFLKVFTDLGFTYFARDHLPIIVGRLVGATIDISWALIVLYALIRATGLARQRRELGIVLNALKYHESEEDDDFLDEEEAEEKKRIN